MSVADKFTSVRVLIDEHNKAIGDKEKPGFVDPGDFIACIQVAGGTSDDRLKRFSYEDILRCLPTVELGGGKNNIQPVALAKDIAAIFRGKDEEPKKYYSNNRVEAMSIDELVKAFDPQEHDNAIGRRLKLISRGEPCVVFESGNSVNVQLSGLLLREIKQGMAGRTLINGKRVYKVGELPSILVDENPLYPGRHLRLDDNGDWCICDQTGRSWSGVPVDVRQFLRVAVKCNEIGNDIDSVHRAIDMAIEQDAFAKLRKRYQKVAVKFDELKHADNLPKLMSPVCFSRAGDLNASGKKVEVW